MNASRITLLVALACLMVLASCDSPPTDCPLCPRDDDYTIGANEFDAAAAHVHIDALASDDMDGRLTGTQQGANAAKYIGERFAEYGLQPLFRMEDYYQWFQSPVTHTLVQPVLATFNPARPDGSFLQQFTVQEDFIPRGGRFLGSGDVSGQVVWLGGCLSDDFNPSLTGKIVLCAPLSYEAREQAVPQALRYGVSGLLEIAVNNGPYLRSAYGWCELIDMPAFMISREIISDLVADSGYDMEDLNTSEAPVPLDIFVRMTASFERVEVEAVNVLGVLRGTDPLIGDEVVIIGAHYDGPGTDPDGTIYNAANDNASGVAVMLEIARLWHAQGVRPARTVIFAAWDGEEQFVQGSSFYVEHPLYPLEQTVAYLNLDAVGVGEIVSIYEERIEPDQVNILAERLQAGAELFGINYHLERDRLSDDMPFHDAGVPATGMMVVLDDLNYYPQLHMPEDDPGIIDDEILQSVGILAAYALFAWAMGR